MSNIDKQWLQQKIAEMEAARDDIPFGLGEDDSNTLAALRIALASLEAEAVCVIDQSNLDYLKSGSDADVWPAPRKEMGDVLLYRAAPPAPVSVPDGYRLQPISEYDAMCAAMLQGADGNSPVIPDGYVLVPKRLTAENGAKTALIGELNLEYSLTCHECFGEGCDDCSGEGTLITSIPVDWSTIKDIWAKAIDHFAAAPQQEVK